MSLFPGLMTLSADSIELGGCQAGDCRACFLSTRSFGVGLEDESGQPIFALP